MVALEVGAPIGAFAGGWEIVVQHELGHVMGLGHVHARGEVMSKPADPLVTDWGPGDLAGLVQLGRSQGCQVTPAATHN